MPLRQKMLNPLHLRAGSRAELERAALDDGGLDERDAAPAAEAMPTARGEERPGGRRDARQGSGTGRGRERPGGG